VTVELVGEHGNETALAFVESNTILSDDAAQELGVEQHDGLTVTVEAESEGSDGGDGSDDADGTDATSDTDDTDNIGDNDSERDDDDDSDGVGGDDGNDDDSDSGSSGDSSGSGDGADGNGDSLEEPPRVASYTTSVSGNASVSTTFDGGSSTVDRLELSLDLGASGEYVTTEFERLSPDFADARSGDAGDVVAVLDVDGPNGSADAPKQITLTLDRSAANASGDDVDGL
jgi:hypothetical protein